MSDDTMDDLLAALLCEVEGRFGAAVRGELRADALLLMESEAAPSLTRPHGGDHRDLEARREMT